MSGPTPGRPASSAVRSATTRRSRSRRHGAPSGYGARRAAAVGTTPATRATRPLRADAMAHASGVDPDALGGRDLPAVRPRHPAPRRMPSAPSRGFAFRRTARDPSLAAFARPPVPSPPGGRTVGAHHTRLREERRPTLVRRRRTLYRNSSRSALTPGTARVRSAAWVLVLASGALPNRVTTPLSERTLMSASLSPPSLPRRSFTAF